MTVAGRDDAVGLYRALALHRAVAVRLERLRGQGRVPVGVRCGIGSEAVSVGAAHALRPAADGSGDAVALTPRNAGALIAFGGTPLELFRQHLARAAAPARGREPGVRYADFARGLMGSVALPGTMVEVMAGVALAFRLRGRDRVALAFSDEAETSASAWHEGVNFAGVQRCPLIVVVQAGTEPDDGAHARPSGCGPMADGYGVAGASVDGGDVLAVRRAVREAAERARAGDGATLIEARGCPVSRRAERVGGEDPGGRGGRRPPDPVARFRARLIREERARTSDLDEAERWAKAEVAAACRQALDEPLPAGRDALGDVYADDPGSSPWYRREPPIRGLALAAAS